MPRPNPLSDPAFAAWFGRSAVVGPDGNPLVVYHGTRAKEMPERFDRSKISHNDPDLPVRGFWFAMDEREAKAYGNGAVAPFYLSAQKLADRKTVWEVAKTQHTTEEITQELIRQGYDGVEFISPRFWTESDLAAVEANLKESGKASLGGGRELRNDTDGGVSLWRGQEHITGYYDAADFAKLDRSSSGYFVIFNPEHIRPAAAMPDKSVPAKQGGEECVRGICALPAPPEPPSATGPVAVLDGP